MQPFKSVSNGVGRTRVRAELYRIGEDLLVIIVGEGAHIGAVSMAEALPGEEVGSATVTARGHKEAELTGFVSQAVCSGTGRRTVALAGIHLDDITQAEIETIRRNVRGVVPLLDLDGIGG
jgi:hypothetical protein